MLLCVEAGKEYQVDLLSAVYLVAAWAKMSATIITKCFYHAGFLRPCDNSEEMQCSDSEEVDTDPV